MDQAPPQPAEEQATSTPVSLQALTVPSRSSDRELPKSFADWTIEDWDHTATRLLSESKSEVPRSRSEPTAEVPIGASAEWNLSDWDAFALAALDRCSAT